MIQRLKRRLKRLSVCAVVLTLLTVAILPTLNSSYRRRLAKFFALNRDGSAAGPSDRRRSYRFGDNSSLTVIDGQHQFYADRVDSLSDASLKVIYQSKSLLEITAEWRLNSGSSGAVTATPGRTWRLCLAGPYRPRSPCLALSFGREAAADHPWSFETETLARQFGCRVFIFDPASAASASSSWQSGKAVQHADLVDRVFYLREGLQGTDDTSAPSPWFTDTYQGHLKRLNADGFVVDLLKIDARGGGEAALQAVAAAAADGSLAMVKQLLLADVVVKVNASSSVAQVKDRIRTHAALHQLGFRLWAAGDYYSQGRRLHYVNTNFAEQEGQSQPGKTLPLMVPDPLHRLPVTLLPAGYKLAFSAPYRLNIASMSATQLREIYRDLVSQLHVHCPQSQRLGNGRSSKQIWEICISEPFDMRATKRQGEAAGTSKACSALSFGIVRSDFAFEDALTDTFPHCRVDSFDSGVSKMSGGENAPIQRRSKSWLHPAANKTLCLLLNQLGTALIDVLKLDFRSWDVASFSEALQDGLCLKRRVKQLVLVVQSVGELEKSNNFHHSRAVVKALILARKAGFVNWSFSADKLYLLNRNLLHLTD